MFPAHTFKDRRVGVFGLARSGTACIEALRLGGAQVFAWDDSQAAVEKAAQDKLPVSDLNKIDFRELDCLILSPGVPLTHPKPHWTVAKAKAAKLEIIGDTEIMQREISLAGAKLVAITGTNGKSTTTALAGHLLQAAGSDAEVGGNIGKAVFLLRQPVKNRIYVLELSSFQIDLMPSLKPDAGILINISPDHLDRHGTMENYAGIKARMFAKQGPEDTAIVSVDDPWCEAIAGSIKTGAEVYPVSVTRKLAKGISAHDGILHDTVRGATIDLRPMPALKGAHNWQNACVAYGAAAALGLTLQQIEAGMKSFPGLAHRMQEIARRNGVVFVNDSKATNADAAAKALASYDTIYWIAGGIAKAGGIDSLATFFPKIVKTYLIGQATEEFAETLGAKARIEKCGTLDQAVEAAARDAKSEKRAGAAVLLSPACASFDQYPNFEVRGEAFVKAVAKLSGICMHRSGG